MKIEFEINIGKYTEQEAKVRISTFLRRQMNVLLRNQLKELKAQGKPTSIADLDKSPEDAGKFIEDCAKLYYTDALSKGAEIYGALQGRNAGRQEAESKLK